MSRVPRPPLLALATLAALALTATSCGTDDRVAPAAAGSSDHPHQHHAGQRPHHQPAEPRRTEPPASPAASATPGQKPLPAFARPRAVLDTHLLTADRMPSPGGAVAWQVEDEGPEDAAVVGACQKTALEPIGAVTAVRRSFAAAGTHAAATQVVARFADPRSAWRAHEVLRAWQADCEQRLDYARTDIGPLQPVLVGDGIGEHYRAAFGPASQTRGWATGLGIVRRGSYLSVVEILTAATDYPTDRDPARRAVRRIARTFD
jgi:hypothetical protein